MKLPVLYAYPFAQMQEAEFSIRFDGVQFTFYCQKLIGYRRRIRKARALLIRGTVITAQPSQHWQFNKNKSHWKFYGPFDGSIPSHEVYWALSDNRNLIETYQFGKISRWKVIRTVRQCYLCDAPYHQEAKQYWYGYSGRFRDNIWTTVCDGCRDMLKLEKAKLKLLKSWWNRHLRWCNLTERREIEGIASQDRSRILRWLRKFTAEGSFTATEFKELCKKYGNVCLRCGTRESLVADHVKPLAKGGTNDISNIQPLCRKCNGIKSSRSTDYRKRLRVAVQAGARQVRAKKTSPFNNTAVARIKTHGKELLAVGS